jgi:hypothetical protein
MTGHLSPARALTRNLQKTQIANVFGAAGERFIAPTLRPTSLRAAADRLALMQRMIVCARPSLS